MTIVDAAAHVVHSDQSSEIEAIRRLRKPIEAVQVSAGTEGEAFTAGAEPVEA